MTIKSDIENKTCSACKTALSSYDNIKYDHFHCEKCWQEGKGIVVKAMYEKNSTKWIMFRFGFPGTDLHVELWDDNISKIYNHKTRKDVDLPAFDIAKCSYEELESKVKLYVMLS